MSASEGPRMSCRRVGEPAVQPPWSPACWLWGGQRRASSLLCRLPSWLNGVPRLGVLRSDVVCAGKDGSYGTSVERYKALDPASDIILAWQQNGRLLTPDHGYPLRIIIPGAAAVPFTKLPLPAGTARWVHARSSCIAGSP